MPPATPLDPTPNPARNLETPMATPQMTLAITADTTGITRQLRIIAKHLSALADELETPPPGPPDGHHDPERPVIHVHS
jgi:hypothetical protein